MIWPFWSTGFTIPFSGFGKHFPEKSILSAIPWGGLLIRAYLNLYGIKGLGRVVLIGTPNGGSEVADYLQKYPVYKWFFGPAGQQLITDQRGVADLFAPINADIGIIAGNKSMPPFGFTMAGRENDGTVSVASTHLMWEKDHLTLPCSHEGLLTSPSVREQTLSFLKNGYFAKS